MTSKQVLISNVPTIRLSLRVSWKARVTPLEKKIEKLTPMAEQIKEILQPSVSNF